MEKIFLTGGDIHAQTASEMFGIPIDRLDKMQHRYPAKRTNFGIPYDISAAGLFRDFTIAGCEGWSVAKCQSFINEWYRLYAGVAEWKKDLVQFARQNGYVEDIFGRRRWVPGVRCRNSYLQEKALREAGNMPIQGGAQGVIKIAMGDLWPLVKQLRQQLQHVNPLIQIHDDLLFEVGDEDLPIVIPAIKFTMETAVQLRIPTPADPEVGKRWSEMRKWKGVV